MFKHRYSQILVRIAWSSALAAIATIIVGLIDSSSLALASDSVRTMSNVTANTTIQDTSPAIEVVANTVEIAIIHNKTEAESLQKIQSSVKALLQPLISKVNNSLILSSLAMTSFNSATIPLSGSLPSNHPADAPILPTTSSVRVANATVSGSSAWLGSMAVAQGSSIAGVHGLSFLSMLALLGISLIVGSLFLMRLGMSGFASNAPRGVPLSFCIQEFMRLFWASFAWGKSFLMDNNMGGVYAFTQIKERG